MKWVIRLVAVVLASGLLVVIVREAKTSDGVVGLLCRGENTRYARGYAEDRFLMVKIGMDEQAVRVLLGEPLGSYDIPEPSPETGVDRALSYSYREHRGRYRLRTLLLSRGKVVRVAAECTDD